LPILLVLTTIYGIFYFFKFRHKRLLAESKVRFFIHTAHEIRTPLTLIKAPLEEISHNETLTERGEQNIQTALKSANDLLILTSNLLNEERQKLHNNGLHLYQTDLTSYMQELIIPFQLYARTKHLDLVYSSAASSKVWIDRNRMDSIMQNVINNALKYTHSGGSITVSTDVADTRWTVRVSDTGIGIPKGEMEKLSNMYFRSSNADNASGGTGVGLYLVRKLVEEHQGTVDLVSEEGKGTTFTLSFPTDYGTGRRVVKMVSRDDAQPSVNGLPTVLIVDDNADMRQFIGDSLADHFNIYAAENGAEAYNKVRFLHPDIIVSDVMMPQMRGDELCRKIKSELETSHIPVVLLSALADKDSVADGLSTLADAYLTKPFSINVLKAQLLNLISNRTALQKVYSSAAVFSEGPVVAETVAEEGALLPDKHEMEFVSKVNELIEKHIKEGEFNVDILCTKIGMSRTSFYNKLRSLTGHPPADYIRIIKIEKSKQMLATTSMPMAEIAEACGFYDAKYFREVFRKNVGISPREFRQGCGTNKTEE
jgi:DNA-binding response OmpR family regulator/two-component sensor histidine kinase